MTKLLPTATLDAIKKDIAENNKIELYKHHEHPDVRAIVARTEHAPQAYIIDESPDVRLALIETGKWLDRIAPTETNIKLIIAIIKQGYTLKKWHTHESQLVQKAIEEQKIVHL